MDRDDIKVSIQPKVSPSHEETRKRIFDIVSDLVSDFTYYDRKEDEELSLDNMNYAIQQGIVSVHDIVGHFSVCLMEVYKPEEVQQEQVERRYAALDLSQLNLIQMSIIINKTNCIYDNDEFKFLGFDYLVNDYYQSSTLEDEGLKLVSFEYFCKINRLV